MNKFFLFLIFIFFYSCSANKSILICGDHECVNKAEAQKYFEENLTLEVKIFDKKKIKEESLIELNLKEENKEKKVYFKKKKETSQKIKVLTKKEIKEIKSKIKKEKNFVKKSSVNKNKNKSKKKLQKNNKKNQKGKINTLISKKDSVDICTIIEECSIDKISEYLIKIGKNKKYPDITQRN